MDVNAFQRTVAFVSGVDATNRVAATSFDSWNNDAPATYGPWADAIKWGGGVPGTPARVTWAFDPAANWSATEQRAFVAAIHLWQAEANITFVQGTAGSAQLTIERNTAGDAEGGVAGRTVAVGSTTLAAALSGNVSIDTTVSGFGPIGGAFTSFGGYPWMTMVHELGHAIGLGHSGPYDDNNDGVAPFTTMDSRQYSIMSYNDATANTVAGYYLVPTTPMLVDIAAAQRLYGVPTTTPLTNVTFGFHTTIQSDIAQFFDFTINTKPMVALWAAGTNNALDLTGYAQASSVNLNQGELSSAGGLSNNLEIAVGARIDTLALGAGADSARGNDDGDLITGGAGADTLTGGAGNDHLYGGGPTQTPGDGADSILGGDGSDYLQGNAGNDTLDGGNGSDRIFGGADNDLIRGSAGNDTINGNLGNDTIDGGDGNDSERGGQGDDSLTGGTGDDTLLGDLGNDTLAGGGGVDQLYGGPGNDLFVLTGRDASFATSGVNAYALVTIGDFTHGADHVHLDMGTPAAIVQAGAAASAQAAAAVALAALANSATVVAAVTVGGDTLLFFNEPGVGEEGVRLAGVADPRVLTPSDFV